MSFQSPNGVTNQAANVRHLDVRQKTVSATVARKKANAYATAAYTYFRETVDDTVFCRTSRWRTRTASFIDNVIPNLKIISISRQQHLT